MTDTTDLDEPISKRRSTRSCRLSNRKSQSNVTIKEVQTNEENPETNEIDDIKEEEEEEEEDPEDPYQVGDIFWVRIAGNPWWPALLYGSYYEDYIHTRIVKTNRRRKKRRYFVYFFGPDFEYSWSDASCLIPYSGLENFLQHAQTAVQNATTKSEQEALATRFELRVAGSKRAPWDKAIEAADQCSQLSREKRIENFAEMLKIILRKSEEKKSRQSSIKKSLPPSNEEKSSKRQKTKSTPVSTSTTLLHVGLPILTKNNEKDIVEKLLNENSLSFEQGQTIACEFVRNLMKENFQFDMTCVQIEWFYDFLLNYPEIVCKHSHWFNKTIKSIFDDSISFKQSQLMKILQNK